MSENDPSQLKRPSALTWYSVYQNQVVGLPSTLWASEDNAKMSNGYDDNDGFVKTNSEESTLDWSHPKDSDNWNHPKDSDNWNHSKDSEDGKYPKDANGIKDEQQQEQTHSSNFTSHTVDNGISIISISSSHGLLRPLSMDVKRMEQKKVKVEGEPGLQRSRSTIASWNEYEEFKLPKQYQKPTNTQINTRLSRTYITGAGNDKCKKCGERLYEMEKINANHSSYHRSCFQCSRCQRLLSLSNFISIDGQIYCSSHFIDVVCNKTNIAETQMSNEADEKHQHLLDIQTISKEVTLTSISDIKSRFQIPSNNEIESERKAKHEDPQKIRPLTEDVSVTRSMTQNVQVQHPKSTFEDSASTSSASSSSHEKMIRSVSGDKDTKTVVWSFEPNAEKTRSQRLKEEEESAFAAHHQSTASPPTFISNGDNYTLPVADAFAIFKTMENMERIPSSEIKPAKKMPLTLHLKTSAKDRLPENKEMGNHLSYFGTTQNAKPDEKLQAVSIQYAAMKENVAALENDVPPVGITKQLVAQWKLMDATDGSSSTIHRSHAQVVSTTPSLDRHHHRQSTTDDMAHDVSGSSSKLTNTSLQLGNGFPVTGPAYGYENTLVRKHKEIVPPQDTTRLLRRRGGEEMAVTEPIDFTRNQLAKFKVLEAMAQKSTNHYPLSKKDFRWDVKEVSPLHRPIVQTNLTPTIQIGLKTDDSLLPAVIHTQLADQTDGWDGWKTDDHTTTVTHTSSLADQRYAIEEQPILACMKEALAQFKSMEDLTRPPPNPVLALSKQRAAIGTHMKQYHDVIHVSYAIQTARD